ncbi:MAG: PhzF family phenazine biosynthesis protein [Bryobacteraceae bacterium]
MRLPLYQVDAFTKRRFAGNPAAVCPLPKWLPDQTLMQIAAENNLAETAYFVAEPDGYRLRWFTPAVEVDLCGHATLASAYVLMDCLGFGGNQVTFHSRSGPLTVGRSGDLYTLDFPSRPGATQPADAALARALGAVPTAILAARDTMCVFESAAQVQALRPNMEALTALAPFAFIATAPGDDCDFVSRFFAPKQGINEDPVTGSAHCTLTPYWSARLGKANLYARQISARGGELWCEDRGDRVRISGHGALYLTGFIEID